MPTVLLPIYAEISTGTFCFICRYATYKAGLYSPVWTDQGETPMFIDRKQATEAALRHDLPMAGLWLVGMCKEQYEVTVAAYDRPEECPLTPYYPAMQFGMIREDMLRGKPGGLGVVIGRQRGNQIVFDDTDRRERRNNAKQAA